MQIINVVIVGNDENSEYIKNSKFVSKVYFAPRDIKFNTFRELAETGEKEIARLEGAKEEW